MGGGPWEPLRSRPSVDRAPARGLDPQSREAVQWFLLRLCCMATISVLDACFEQRSPVRAFVGTLTLTCALAAVVCALRAAWDGHAFARGRLNTWDEALAFLALSRAAHLALGLGWA